MLCGRLGCGIAGWMLIDDYNQMMRRGMGCESVWDYSSC